MQIFRRKSIDNNTFSRNSSQFLKNSSQIPCTFRFLSLPLPSLRYPCGALRMNKGRDDMFKPNQLFLNVVGLFFLPITCRIDTRVIRPLFMRSTPHDVEMPETEYGGSPSTCFLALCGGEHGCCSRRGSASRFFRTPTSTRAGAVLR